MYAKHVVNCTGAFADKIRLKDDPNAKKRICIVGGSHITYSNKISSNKYGICFPSSDGRILLLVPWQGRVIAGTTEQPFDEPENNPLCNEEERTFIRGGVHETMSELSYEELFDLEVAHWCGLRPLVISNDDKDVH